MTCTLASNILVALAVATNVAAAVWTVVRARKKLRQMDALIHEMENLRAQMQEFTYR